jgi:hypothetical protein
MTYEKFEEDWNELSVEDKIACYNEYAYEYNPDDALYDFEDDFFDEHFENNPSEAVRACFFGDIKSWSDEYIRFNGYANLVSLSKYEAEEWATDNLDEIYEHEDIWSRYIDDEEDDDEEEDTEE